MGERLTCTGQLARKSCKYYPKIGAMSWPMPIVYYVVKFFYLPCKRLHSSCTNFATKTPPVPWLCFLLCNTKFVSIIAPLCWFLGTTAYQFYTLCRLHYQPSCKFLHTKSKTNCTMSDDYLECPYCFHKDFHSDASGLSQHQKQSKTCAAKESGYHPAHE